ncbi:MAG: tryptophan 2,3-dioxygenase family protein [Candidatus Promineifilaceae bacterium]
MNRDFFYKTMNGKGTLDYEIYLNTKDLLACQKDFNDFTNQDELMFQIAHQAQELWMKLLAYTLLDIDDYLQKKNTNRVITLFRRVNIVLEQMINGIGVLETMSPKEYQEIRLQLGNGSGQESPGFRTLLKMNRPLWQSFVATYLDPEGLTIEKIYDSSYCHTDAYVIAEALAEYDELFRRFRYRHIQLIERTIGIHSKSLKGRAVTLLEDGLHHHFFPELWTIRSQMTDKWGAQYGVVRDAIGH